MEKINNSKVGEIGFNNNGSKMTIVGYKNYRDITIQFETGNIVEHTTYIQFKNGEIKNLFEVTVFGHGYLGVGKYTLPKGLRYRDIRSYNVWSDMLRRCYSDKFQEKFPSYINCSVCEEWHNYQNFAKWYDENYYEIEGKKMCLDKDILVKGNKVYSPKTCIFVSNEINCLFVKATANRGEYPIGVTYNKRERKYRAKCNKEKGKSVELGSFNTPEQAFFTYKTFKEKLIKDIADEYKDLIPEKLYKAMYEYNIYITD